MFEDQENFNTFIRFSLIRESGEHLRRISLTEAFEWLLPVLIDADLWGVWETTDTTKLIVNGLVTPDDCANTLSVDNEQTFVMIDGVSKDAMERHLSLIYEEEGSYERKVVNEIRLVLRLSDTDRWVIQSQSILNLHTSLSKAFANQPLNWKCSEALVTLSGLSYPQLRPFRYTAEHVFSCVLETYTDLDVSNRLVQGILPSSFKLTRIDEHTILSRAKSLNVDLAGGREEERR